MSLVVSCFTGRYVALWPDAFPARPLRRPPMFDGRAVCYPSDAALRDYLAWRQVDAHINNQARQPLLRHCLGAALARRWQRHGIGQHHAHPQLTVVIDCITPKLHRGSLDTCGKAIMVSAYACRLLCAQPDLVSGLRSITPASGRSSKVARVPRRRRQCSRQAERARVQPRACMRAHAGFCLAGSADNDPTLAVAHACPGHVARVEVQAALAMMV